MSLSSNIFTFDLLFTIKISINVFLLFAFDYHCIVYQRLPRDQTLILSMWIPLIMDGSTGGKPWARALLVGGGIGGGTCCPSNPVAGWVGGACPRGFRDPGLADTAAKAAAAAAIMLNWCWAGGCKPGAWIPGCWWCCWCWWCWWCWWWPANSAAPRLGARSLASSMALAAASIALASLSAIVPDKLKGEWLRKSSFPEREQWFRVKTCLLRK